MAGAAADLLGLGDVDAALFQRRHAHARARDAELEVAEHLDLAVELRVLLVEEEERKLRTAGARRSTSSKRFQRGCDM